MILWAIKNKETGEYYTSKRNNRQVWQSKSAAVNSFNYTGKYSRRRDIKLQDIWMPVKLETKEINDEEV